MKKLAVLGGNGLLGSDLVKLFSSNFEVTSITRNTYEQNKGQEFDLFINANGNSKRFWALQNVYQDFEASTVSVYKTMFDFQFKKYVYISSVDVYPDPSKSEKTHEDKGIEIEKQNMYGFHKYLSEQTVRKHVADWIILRCSTILGTNLKKGPVFDILNNNPIFVTLDTKLQFVTARAIAEGIEALLDNSVTREVFNVGGMGTFAFTKIREYFDKEIQVSPEARTQTYEMNVEKLKGFYQGLKTSEEYLQDFVKDYQNSRINHGQE